ncbi:hypothetical protein [Enterococcus mundtii]|uniref:Uncharacterized protein n=1 Tax=Enterococcus mundtii TaxID=53346 RepID=A0A242KZ92_ENTMU|nr:hypothetical protein [Enterococcus mundtii]OTP27264.1 hypothetical protein A5802_000999 [Enterococcus mundtii]
MGIAIVNEKIMPLVSIALLLWFMILSLLLVSLLWKNKKATYSWDKKGAKVVPLVLAVVLHILFGVFIGIIFYHISVIRF